MQNPQDNDLRDFIRASAAALNGTPAQRAEWLKALQAALAESRRGGESTRPEAEWLEALVELLQGNSAQLPEDHPYASLLAEVKAQSELDALSDEQLAADIFNAVQELLAAEDWQDTRRVMENRQRLLFLPQTDDLFKVFIRQAQSKKDEESVKALKLHQRLVQLAIRDGIPAAFERLNAALRS